MIALVDCQSFYCSCEQVFRPDLKGKPVIVLSNNDGCVVAANREAKALGIPMFAPVFQCEHLIRQHGIIVFSSNYTLYGDMSRRVMMTLEMFSAEIEQYSIDEAFLVVPTHETDLMAWGQRIRAVVKKYTGLPVSIGIGSTKALAKVAQRLAKRNGGCLSLESQPAIDAALEQTEVGQIWGIGPAYEKKLKGHGILSAREFRDCADKWIQDNLTIVGLRLCHELRGIQTLGWEYEAPPKKNICVSRAFGAYVGSLDELKEAVATYTSRAAEKLRCQNSLAGGMTIFFRTNPFAERHLQLQRNGYVSFPVPTSATHELIGHAMKGLEAMYVDGYQIKKAGVILEGIVQADCQQGNFFNIRDRAKDDRLIKAMDKCNREHGARVVRFAAEGVQPQWQTRFLKRSPKYTTRLSEVIAAG